jgi:hypothetical protein
MSGPKNKRRKQMSTESKRLENQKKMQQQIAAEASSDEALMKAANVAGRVLWAITLLFAGYGLLHFFGDRASTVPEKAVLAAESLAAAAIPYVIARAWDELFAPRWE